MVEASKSAAATTQNGATNDLVMDFFDDVWGKVPPVFRQINQDYLAQNGTPAKDGKNKKSKDVSKQNSKDSKKQSKKGKSPDQSSRDGVKNKNGKSSETNVSLFELSNRANAKIEEMRQINASKSVAKIKELTAMHQLKLK